MTAEHRAQRSQKSLSPATLSLEDALQTVVNNLSKILTTIEADSGVFKHFESIFESSTTLDQVVAAISQMTQIAAKTLAKKSFVSHILSKRTVSPATEESAVKGSKPSLSKALPSQNSSLKFPSETPAPLASSLEIGNQNYESLERLLQKYEAEIRDHVRIEQQMKIYADGLEESLAELRERVKSLESEALDNQNKCAELQREIKNTRNESKISKNRMLKKTAFGSELSLLQHRHQKQVSMDYLGNQSQKEGLITGEGRRDESMGKLRPVVPGDGRDESKRSRRVMVPLKLTSGDTLLSNNRPNSK